MTGPASVDPSSVIGRARPVMHGEHVEAPGADIDVQVAQILLMERGGRAF
jgi:hypothetical protein